MGTEPILISGGMHIDGRGSIGFVNDFQFEGVTRFYHITHSSTELVRAWQGHQIESKWFFVSSGAFKIVLVKIDDWDHPGDVLTPLEFIMEEGSPNILYLPPGYANGFQALVPGSKLMVFSSLSLEASKKDDIRYDKDRWYKW